jgi:hypothetical protein
MIQYKLKMSETKIRRDFRLVRMPYSVATDEEIEKAELFLNGKFFLYDNVMIFRRRNCEFVCQWKLLRDPTSEDLNEKYFALKAEGVD